MILQWSVKLINKLLHSMGQGDYCVSSVFRLPSCRTLFKPTYSVLYFSARPKESVVRLPPFIPAAYVGTHLFDCQPFRSDKVTPTCGNCLRSRESVVCMRRVFMGRGHQRTRKNSLGELNLCYRRVCLPSCSPTNATCVSVLLLNNGFLFRWAIRLMRFF